MAELTERQKFDAWCKRRHYYQKGLRTQDQFGRTSHPPRDVDLAWEAWQEAVRTCGVGASEISSYDAASLYCWNEPPADGVDAPVEAIDTSAQPVEKDGANRHDSGVRVPVVVDGRTEEQWCAEACRIGAYDYVEVVEGVKGRWIRTFTGERTPEKIEQSIKALKAQAERYDRTHDVPASDKAEVECWACNDTGRVATSSNGEYIPDAPCAACTDDVEGTPK